MEPLYTYVHKEMKFLNLRIRKMVRESLSILTLI
jgi:hypothetical protein